MYAESRERFVDWLRRQLIGPAHEDILQLSPLERYPTGVLHPVDPDVSGTDPAAEGYEEAEAGFLDDLDHALVEDGESVDETTAQPARRRRYVPPSSVGFSFYVRGEVSLSISAFAAVYHSGGTENRDELGQFMRLEYAREELPEHIEEWPGPLGKMIWNGRAGIDVQERPHGGGRILTVTLCNRGALNPDAPSRQRTVDRVAKSLFEARLECVVESGQLIEYPRVDPSLLTEEEQELELQYRNQRIYAVGHGAAADWEVTDRKARIWSEFMPAAKVPKTTNIGTDDSALSMARLAAAPMHDELMRFVEGYANWMVEQKRIASKLESDSEQATAKRMCDRMDTALARMRKCIEMLRTDPLADQSFRLANQAMLNQMRQAHQVEGKETELSDYRWRPFQLAFLLTVMVSTIREEDDFRDVLDLIWFPTGGGKTEAYLGLIAFLIIWRRLKYPDSGGGTVAFMRYTLRLLTRQQFERAARVVCALELIRRKNPKGLGNEPIDIGIWVGSAISPNGYVQARKIVGDIKEGESNARYKLLLERCPWCDAPFDPVRGYVATLDKFHFHCTHDECEFSVGSQPLPCNVVDEALYARPPSLLIATIDKFARVAWEERAGVFFGAGTPTRPPELIIQDELHLITGPLGSVAGLYEAGLDTLLVQQGVRPKYVASTATIRMAHEQVRRLYARELAVFPPPGLSHDDSYFAQTDRERPGRLYVGYLAPMLDQQHCLAPLAAALFAGPHALFERDSDQDALLDAWWTLVVYHGSLKGVGNSHNAFEIGVREIGQRLVGEMVNRREAGGDATADATAVGPDNISSRFQSMRLAQLTSLQTAEKNAETFEKLTMSREETACLDAVLATNMVSVGLDVDRLALMVVNGQPLTTAEYIQASSRVGRADVPGLVLINYYRHQACSLSHYENFRPYHDSFYRFVEPSSVTPFTYQVRSRALHAALVISLRHGCSALRGNKSAGNFDPELPEVRAVITELKQRCCRAVVEAAQGDVTASHIDDLVKQWHDEAWRCEKNSRQLNYKNLAQEHNADRLLYQHGESRPGLWPTLNSMRNVEGTGALKVHNWPPRT